MVFSIFNWLEWSNSHQCTSSRWGRSSYFGDEPKTHPFPPLRDFFGPFSALKFSPLTYPPLPTFPPPPTSFTSFLVHSIAIVQESPRAWVVQSFEETWGTRLEEGGEFNIKGKCRGECKRNASSQMQKREKKHKLPPFFAFFFLSFFHFFYNVEVKKEMAQVCCCFFFLLLFFATNKAMTTSLLSSPDFSSLLVEVK